MDNEVIIAGLFGMFSTLFGVVVAYALSFSRDQRIQASELKVIYSSLIVDLNAVKVGFERNKSYLPRMSSLNLFMIKGGYSIAPVELALMLEELTHDLSRIEDITKVDHAYNVALASAGETGLMYNNNRDLKERSHLINSVLDKIPQVISHLEANA